MSQLVNGKTRWGRKFLICDGSHVWWAREDLTGGQPVVFAIAHEAQDALRRGEMTFKACSVCDIEELHEYNDYICRTCRNTQGYG